MKSFYSILFLCGLVIALVACSSVSDSTPTLVSDSTSTRIIPSQTLEPTQTPVPPSPTWTVRPPAATATSLPPTETPLPACVVLTYGEYAQFEITGPSGQRVLVDVYEPERLSSPVVENDILLTTHTHWDHWNEDFQVNFPGMQLFAQTGLLEGPETIIQGIASAHNEGDRLKSEKGTNTIYLIEIGGLRIAHFGDIGQRSLTEEQLSVLEAVDIAITQVNNPYSEMNAENRKGISLIEQVRPRLVIPTHLNLDTVKLAVAQWDGYYAGSTSLEICEPDLRREGTEFLILGEAGETMAKYVDLMAWKDR